MFFKLNCAVNIVLLKPYFLKSERFPLVSYINLFCPYIRLVSCWKQLNQVSIIKNSLGNYSEALAHKHVNFFEKSQEQINFLLKR